MKITEKAWEMGRTGVIAFAVAIVAILLMVTAVVLVARASASQGEGTFQQQVHEPDAAEVPGELRADVVRRCSPTLVVYVHMYARQDGSVVVTAGELRGLKHETPTVVVNSADERVTSFTSGDVRGLDGTVAHYDDLENFDAATAPWPCGAFVRRPAGSSSRE